MVKRKVVEEKPKRTPSKTFRTGLSIRAKYQALIDIVAQVPDRDKSARICELAEKGRRIEEIERQSGLRFDDLVNNWEQVGNDGIVPLVSTAVYQPIQATVSLQGSEVKAVDLEENLDDALFAHR